MRTTRTIAVGCALCAVLLGGLYALAQNKPEDGERKVKENEVPKAALDALKKLADKAEIKEFAEEIEHGRKFYEGSWTGPNGNIDALVTESGDLVEIEETIPADKAPSAVRAAAEKEAGKDVKLTYEKKTMVLYEMHYKKDGKTRELILTPDARPYHEEGEKKGDKDEDDKDEDD